MFHVEHSQVELWMRRIEDREFRNSECSTWNNFQQCPPTRPGGKPRKPEFVSHWTTAPRQEFIAARARSRCNSALASHLLLIGFSYGAAEPGQATLNRYTILLPLGRAETYGPDRKGLRSAAKSELVFHLLHS